MIKHLLTHMMLISLLNAYVWADDAAPPTTAGANAQSYLDSVQQFQLQTHNGKLSRATATFYYNTSLSVIQALYGTWQISVPIPQVHTDTLQVDANFIDNNFGYYGWDSKQNVSCFYEPNMFGTIYSYQCLYVLNSAAGISQRYLFNLNGNSLSGKYHSGTAADFIAKLNANQLVNITGTNPAKSAEPTYSDSTGELVIPKVSVNGKNYGVIMKRENNGLFSVKTANPL